MTKYSSKLFIGISSKWVPNMDNIVKEYNSKPHKFKIISYIKDNETIYLARTSTLMKIANIPFNIFCFLNKKQKGIYFINTINDNLQDICTKIITINGQSKTLIQWSKAILKSKNYLIKYCYARGLKNTINYIKYHLSYFNKIHVKEALVGKSFTINGISNNLYKWSILCGYTYINYIYTINKQQLHNIISNTLCRKSKEINYDYIEVNNLYASCERWSLFINKPKNYLKNMIMSMGYQYTVNFLHDIVNSDINNCRLITINNESLTLYGWAKKLKKNNAYFYYLQHIYGLDHTIKLIHKYVENNK